MQIIILDSSKVPVGTLDTTSDDTPISNDVFKQYLETGAYTYEFDILVNDTCASTLVEGNYLLFKWHDKWKLLQMETVKDTEEGSRVSRNIYAVPCSLELYQNHVRQVTLEGTIEHCLNTILQDTNFVVGDVSPTLSTKVEQFTVSSITPVYTVLQDLISVFDNAELDFRVEVSKNYNFKFYIDIYADGERGNKTYKRFEHDWNTYGTKREKDHSEYYSGLIAQGVNGVTFKDLYWSTLRGDPLDKPIGQDYLVDPEIHAVYNNGGKYILGSYNSSTANTAIDLLWETYNQLQEIKNPKISYETNIYLTAEEYDTINIGDTVHVVNTKFNPPIQLEARIGTLEISFTDYSKNKVTLSNYKELKSKIRHYSNEDIINEAVNTVLGLGTGKLSAADRAKIQELLAKLHTDKDASDKILDDLVDKLKPGITVSPDDVGEDTEDYSQIKINYIDGGLWIGDKRIHDIKKNKLSNISSQDKGEVKPSTIEYDAAVKYYAQFNLSKNYTLPKIQNVRSASNKYKIPTMVNYWSNKFGLDPEMVFMAIAAESAGDPYEATKYSGGGYGLMQCERDAYFNKKQTITFLDGTTKTFTPSYSTMQPTKGGTTTVNGVTVDKNINNQIMFGCHEMRYSLNWCHTNIFATLISFNMGIGAVAWIVNKYVAEKYGFTFKNSYLNFSSLPTDYRLKSYEVLESGTGDFASYRKAWVDYRNSLGKPAGTLNNIEGYLQFYNVINGQLPYSLDKSGKKVGYGVSTPAISSRTVQKGSSARDTIVELAKTIVSQHVDQKIATYDQSYRTVNFDKPSKRSGTFYGIKNPICYDCSSLVSCCYLKAGMKSVYAKSCYLGTLVAGATAKSGYSMWKVDAAGLKKAKPGDIVMDANFKITSDNLTRANMIKEGKTHHTMIYIGDGKVAHASQWAQHPNAIKISNISYYQNKGTAFFLRPYELAELDKNVSKDESTGGAGDNIVDDTIIPSDNISAMTIKAMPGATAANFLVNDKLETEISTSEGIVDSVPYPSTVDYIFLHFGIPNVTDTDAQDVINLVEALRNKYIKTPIFIAKEWNATNTYANAAAVNAALPTYNATIENYANQTPYVIFLDVGTLPGTADGYTCNTKAHAQTYYTNVKTAIKNKVLGYKPKDDNTSTGGTTPGEDPGIGGDTSGTDQVVNKVKINYVLQSRDEKDFKTVDEITIKLPSAVTQTYWAKYKFTTKSNSEPTKFTQSAIAHYIGDDCKNGALIVNAATKYSIIVMSNPDKTQYQGKKYVAVVSANKGTGKFTDCGDFVGRDKFLEIAETYYKQRTKFIYNTKTPLSFSNPSAHKSEWTTNGKFHIDCSTFVGLCCRGITYEESPYAKTWTTNTKRNSKLSWTFNPGRYAASIGQYCISQGWVATGIDVDNWTNIEKGDIIFWDRDNKDLNRFMSISHVGICSGNDSDGDATTIEVTTVTNAVYKRKLKNNTPGKVLFVARIRKD